MKLKFMISTGLGGLWLSISIFFALKWIRDIARLFPDAYLWWSIAGMALLPGFLMSCMFFSNLMHRTPKAYRDVTEDTTILLCAYNEENTIALAITAIFAQKYSGAIRLLAIDNGSSDRTGEEILRLKRQTPDGFCLEYVYCSRTGKSHALNKGLALVDTPHFITVDADTFLEPAAVQKIMNHIVSEGSACVAGNLFAANPKASFVTKMQNYDYLLSISAIKRFQGSYRSTLVAQGAFSAYSSAAVQSLGGWQPVLGEDIVLTYQLLQQGLASTYEPMAAGRTAVPESIGSFYNQRKRWAIGMIEGLSAVPPRKQGNFFSKYFTYINLSVVYLDLAFLFGFMPSVMLALLGYSYLAGLLTLFSVLISLVLFFSMYRYQARLEIPFENSLSGFVCFLVFFQAIQSTAALHGYFIRLFRRKGEWK